MEVCLLFYLIKEGFLKCGLYFQGGPYLEVDSYTGKIYKKKKTAMFMPFIS